MISADVLRTIRNDLPMTVTIRLLARDGPYGKMSEGFFRFICPYCHEIRATVNPRNNLAHCFCCHKNINNIDLLLSVGYDFKSAVVLLKKWLKEFNQSSGPAASENERSIIRLDRGNRPMKLAQILSKISSSAGIK